jgi:hypothetical protein
VLSARWRDRGGRADPGARTCANLLSLAHFLIWLSLLMRKMPLPWALADGFIIHVADGFRLNSSTNSE